MRVVLDTNVLIAAALKGGLSEQIIRLAAAGKLQLIISDEILDELLEKLIQKFAWKEKEAKLYADTLGEIGERVKITNKLKVIKRDPDDDKILETAITAHADLIVSIDKDLLKLKNYKRIGIVHPKTLTWIIPKLFEDKR